MIRQIIIPENNTVTLQIPIDFIGKQIEILAFLIQEEVKNSIPVWKSFKGKYKGKLSSVDNFMKNKQVEKKLDL